MLCGSLLECVIHVSGDSASDDHALASNHTDEEAMSNLPQERFETLHEIVKFARNRVSPNIWDYLVGGAETETTLARNRMALDTVALRPRVLNNVDAVDASADFFGHRIRLPVFCAPVGSLPGTSLSLAPVSWMRTTTRFSRTAT